MIMKLIFFKSRSRRDASLVVDAHAVVYGARGDGLGQGLQLIAPQRHPGFLINKHH